MAIIPCRECAHHVSDQAVSCPSCGAPVAQAVKTRPRGKRRVVATTLITLMALWTLGTLAWLIVPRAAPNQLARAKASFDRGIGRLWTTAPIQTTQPAPAPVRQPAPAPSASGQSAPALRAVYRTTAEQLYRDYEANVVATQTKIGTSRVRLAGNVAEIDQDGTGRPVVKLWADKNTTAAMTLADDQRAAAAQLAKNEAVEVECDRIGRSGAELQGSDCTLALVDLRPKEVNLALFLGNESGPTRVYVVGPMPEAVCLTRSAEISSALQKSQRGEHVVSRNCTDAARERIAPGGCRLNASAVSVAEVPAAHLWRYDCSSSSVARTSRRKRAPGAPVYETTLPAIVANVPGDPNADSGGNGAAANSDSGDSAAQPVPLPVVDAVAVQKDPATAPTTNNLRLASAANSDTGTAAPHVPAEESTVAHAMQSQSQSNDTSRPQTEPPHAAPMPAGTATPIPDDLARVKAEDPQAAEHIAKYCAQSTAATNRDAYMADCRRSEAEAWTRFVQQNEFPTLDEATRRRCSQPPFPDTYVAKESCARYLLHVN